LESNESTFFHFSDRTTDFCFLFSSSDSIQRRPVIGPKYPSPLLGYDIKIYFKTVFQKIVNRSFSGDGRSTRMNQSSSPYSSLQHGSPKQPAPTMTENSTLELSTDYVSATDGNNGEQSSSQQQAHSPPLPNITGPIATKHPRLNQLDGFRFLVAFWLVFAHNLNATYNEVGTLYERFCYRRYFGVQFFLVLSGFVSQYAYGQKSFSSRTGVFKFIVGRIGSVLACHYSPRRFP
jgi:hypothetical protein